MSTLTSLASSILVLSLLVGVSPSQTLVDTLPANDQATLSADAAQTFTITTVGTPQISAITVEGPQTGSNAGPFVLELYSDTDGDHGTWDPATLISGSTSESLVTGGATTTTFNFNDSTNVAPAAVYGFLYTDGGGTAISARMGLTNANDIDNGTLFSGGAIPGFGNGFDTAMQIAITNDSNVIDNANLPNLVTTGSQATFEYQTFTPNVGGPGTTDNIATVSPLADLVTLDNVGFFRAPSGSATAGELFIDLYEGGAGDAGMYLGSSIDSHDVNSADPLSFLVWNFEDIVLDSGLEYSLVFSSDDLAGGTVGARIAAANNGGGFVSTYSGGFASGGGGVVPFDARFAVGTSNVVPEPASIALWSLIGLRLGAFGVYRARQRK